MGKIESLIFIVQATWGSRLFELCVGCAGGTLLHQRQKANLAGRERVLAPVTTKT